MYRFSSFPKSIDVSVYQDSQEAFVGFLAQQEGFLSLFRIGELGLYGVSDLDYVIVYQDFIDQDSIFRFAKNSPLIDTLIFVEVSHIDDIYYRTHHFEYEYISGVSYHLSFPTQDKFLQKIYCWKLCFTSLLRNFYTTYSQKHIQVYSLLSQIYDIRYAIFFLSNLGIKKTEWGVFLSDFSEYRKNYFIHKDFQKLSYYLETAIDISWEMVYELDILLSQNQETQTFTRKEIYGRFATLFVKFPEIDQYRKRTERYARYYGFFSRFLILPTSFYFPGWQQDLHLYLEKVKKYNPGFLDFGLKGYFFSFLLVLKSFFDLLTFRFLGNK